MLTHSMTPEGVGLNDHRNGDRQRTERRDHNARLQLDPADDRLVLTRSGLAVECRRCGRTLAIQATPDQTAPEAVTS